MALKQKFEEDKPWAILRMPRKRYEAAQPWKKAGFPRAKFEKLLLLIPDELISEMRDHAVAEILVESIFGKGTASD
jgi:hypothetical protein